MYINLPGSYVQLQDGNLTSFTRDTTPSVLVLGTASKGLTSEPFLATDLLAVVNEFGATSEVTRAVSEARKGGATNIVVYRLPGIAPYVSAIGADISEGAKLGFKVTPLQASPEAAAKYAVAYRHAKNIGDAGDAADGIEVLGELIVVNLDTNEVVWKGSAAAGAITDLGEVDVQFELDDIASSTGSDAETLNIVATGSVGFEFTELNYSFAISGIVATGTYTVGQPYDTAGDVGTALAAALNANAQFQKLPFSAVATGSGVKIVADGDTNADGDLVYGATHPWAGYLARPFFTATPTVTGATGDTGSVILSFDTPVAYGGAADVGLYPADDARPFAPAVGGVFVPLDKILDGGAAYSFGINRQAFAYVGLTAAAVSLADSTDAAFYAGDAQESVSLMKRYEKLHTAFEDLDLAAFDYIYPCGVALDSKNVTDADVLAETVTVTYTADTYPTPKSASDYLGYCHIKNNGDYTYTYLWSDTGSALKIASDGPIAAHADETFNFKEVNFAYLLANYCYENSSDYKFVHGVIGTRVPDGVNPRAIRMYYGSAPSYTLNQEDGSYFVASAEADGTGLLGHRFVGGRSDFNGGLKHGGFFATVDNSLDYETQGNLLTDENGKKIDLGKYISVVSAFGRLIDDVNIRRPTYLANAAAVVAGMLPRTPIADSLINRQIPGLAIDYRLESKMVDVACGLGLVLAKNEGGAPLLADSPTFASPTSDYTRLTSMRIVAKIAQELRAAARPYIGKGMSAPKRAALESAIGEVFKYNMNGETQQTITSGMFKIEQSASDRVLGKMKVKVTLTPVFELRQITFSVNLSAQ